MSGTLTLNNINRLCGCRHTPRQLSKITRVPQAAYFREAVEDLLRKYEDVLSKAGKPSSTKTRK
jgi:hypothetical protein